MYDIVKIISKSNTRTRDIFSSKTGDANTLYMSGIESVPDSFE